MIKRGHLECEMRCWFEQVDGRMVNCANRVYDKIVDYVNALEPIPTDEEGPLSVRHEDNRYQMLTFVLSEMKRPPRQTEAPGERADREPPGHG